MEKPRPREAGWAKVGVEAGAVLRELPCPLSASCDLPPPPPAPALVASFPAPEFGYLKKGRKDVWAFPLPQARPGKPQRRV